MTRRRGLAIARISCSCSGVVLAVALGVAGCGTSRTGPEEKVSGASVTVDVNSLAPAFAADTLQGGTARLADYMGTHVVLLEFWSTFCKSCIEEMPHIEKLHERYSRDGLAVLSINTDVFSAKRVSSFLEKAGIHPPYPVVRDARQEVVAAYKVEVLPVTVIIDRSGWIRLYQEGYRPGDERRFESKIRKLLGRGGDEDITLAPRDGVTVFAPARVALAEAGKRVEPLMARTLDEQQVELGKGAPCLLAFWSLFCKPCREEFPALAGLVEKYGQRGLRVFSVNVDSDRLASRVGKFSAEHPAVPCLMDGAESEGKGELSQALGVRATPTHVLLDGTGQVVFSAAGTSDLVGLEAKIAEVLEARASPKATR